MRLVPNEVAGPQRPTLPLTLALLLVVAASLLFTAGATRAAQHAAVNVISMENSIDFGRSITVRLEAESDEPVTEVRAVYTARGNRLVSSYAYPEFTQDGAVVMAEVTVETGGRSYYPPGTEFEFVFELTTATGTDSTPPARVTYLDPDHQWQLMARPEIPLDIFYYEFSEATAEAMADRVEASWREIAATVGVDPGDIDRQRAVIYPDINEFNAVAPPVSEAASDGLYFGGFAMYEYGLFVLGMPSPDSVVHEFTHLMIEGAVTSPLSPGVPSWLHEGLAQYFEAGSSEHYSSQLRSRARANDLLVLRNRNTVPSVAAEIGLFYTQVGSFIGNLVEQHGPAPMARTLELINGGTRAADALGEAYGKPFWQLENDWRVSLGADPLPDPSATPAAGESPGAQPTATPDDAGIVVETPPGDSDGGFSWVGPAIGAGAAVIVFAGWSVITSRRRLRRGKR